MMDILDDLYALEDTTIISILKATYFLFKPVFKQLL